MLNHCISIFVWLLDLFNAPPRAAMTSLQKVGRSFLVTGTLVVLSILTAMVGAVGLYIVERIHRALSNIPDLWNTASIIIVGLVVNAICVYVLFQVRKFDRNLMRGTGETPARP